MKKAIGFWVVLLVAGSLCAQTPTPTVAADPTGAGTNPAPTWAAPGAGTASTREEGDYFGIGGGVDFPIQSAGTNQHGVLALVSGHPLPVHPFVGEGEFDGMIYNAGSGGILDMRLFATAKYLPDIPYIFIQPYALVGFGFAGLLGVNADTPNLLSLDFLWGAGFRVEMLRRTYLYLDWKMQILVRDYPTAIDSPLTGGILFPL